MGDATKILVTGANGQVGHELLRALAEARRAHDGIPPRLRRDPLPAEGGEFALQKPGSERGHSLPWEGGRCEASGGCELASFIVPATRTGTLENGDVCERIDLADFDALTAVLDRIQPDLILNAAAYTAVDRAEDEPDLAQRINGDALGVIGEWAAGHAARVVHYSTDYVFDGSATRAYREGDATHPVSAYGRSKLAGEVALRATGARHLVFRTAWVYAARGRNFMRTMLRLGAERDELRVVDDQIGAPTPARLIADVTARAVTRWYDNDAPTCDGTYHLVASGQTSWCGFARAIFERALHAGLLVRPPQVHAIRSADYPAKATRPAWSVLDTTKLRATFGIPLPDWRAALDGVIGELAAVRFQR